MKRILLVGFACLVVSLKGFAEEEGCSNFTGSYVANWVGAGGVPVSDFYIIKQLSCSTIRMAWATPAGTARKTLGTYVISFNLADGIVFYRRGDTDDQSHLKAKRTKTLLSITEENSDKVIETYALQPNGDIVLDEPGPSGDHKFTLLKKLDR